MSKLGVTCTWRCGWARLRTPDAVKPARRTSRWTCNGRNLNKRPHRPFFLITAYNGWSWLWLNDSDCGLIRIIYQHQSYNHVYQRLIRNANGVVFPVYQLPLHPELLSQIIARARGESEGERDTGQSVKVKNAKKIIIKILSRLAWTKTLLSFFLHMFH